MKQRWLARFAIVAVTGPLSVGISVARQLQQTAITQFEVATIKPANPHAVGSAVTIDRSDQQFRLVNMPLRRWVEIGLSVNDYALKAPSWTNTSSFDLKAKAPAGEVASAEMLKSLLIERFELKWHEESQSVAGYELVPDKKVLVKPASVLERMKGIHGSTLANTLIGGTNMSMLELAEALTKSLGRPVVDRTQLSSGFDFKLIWRPDDDAAAAEWKKHGIDVDNLPSSVFTAVSEQLGLKLHPTMVPGKVIVVDHIDRQPTEN